MEKNSAKISLGTAVCLIIIMLLIVALMILYYFGFIKRTEKEQDLLNENNKETMVATNVKNQTKEDEEKNVTEIKSKDIPTSDLTTLRFYSTYDGISIFYAYIDDGYMYYYKEENIQNTNNGDEFHPVYGIGMMTKYTTINNIARIKKYNFGTGINQVPLLITEDGKVYEVLLDEGDLKTQLYEGLKEYKVEDILSHDGEMYDVFEILLKDGTTKTVTVNGDI